VPLRQLSRHVAHGDSAAPAQGPAIRSSPSEFSCGFGPSKLFCEGPIVAPGVGATAKSVPDDLSRLCHHRSLRGPDRRHTAATAWREREKTGARSVVVWRRRGGATRQDRCAEEAWRGRRGGDDPLGRKGGLPRGHDGREGARERRDCRRWVLGAPRVTPSVRLERSVEQVDRPWHHRGGEVQGDVDHHQQRDQAEPHDGR
jgi:hypothetical protein